MTASSMWIFMSSTLNLSLFTVSHWL